MQPAVASASSIVEKFAQSRSHVLLNISRQNHPSSRKDSPKSVTYSDVRTEFARAATDFELDAVAMAMLQERRKTTELRLQLFTNRPKCYEHEGTGTPPLALKLTTWDREQVHQTRFVRITYGGLAIWFDPFGVLEPQVMVNLLPKLGIGVDLERRGHCRRKMFMIGAGVSVSAHGTLKSAVRSCV